MDKNKKILVTGAGGMVGQNLLPKLKKKGYRKILSPSSKDLDLRDQARVRSYFKKNEPAYVIHLAAKVGGILANTKYPADFLYENLLIALNVLENSKVHRVEKLLNLGSSCIYPAHCRQPMREEDLLTGKLEPTNEGYALSKICALKLCEYENKQHGTNFINLMPSNIYGPGDHFEPLHSHVVSALILKFHEAIKNKKPFVEVWGTGAARREFVFVGDVVDAMLYFLDKYESKDLPPFINIGPGSDITIKNLAFLLKRITGYKGKILFDPTKPNGMMKKCLDVSLAGKLGWTAKTELS